MTIEEVRAFVESLGGVLVLAPGPGDGTPGIAWGDLFFYYAPDGVLPQTQPFATVTTKDYPDEPRSGLDRPGAFRVNVGVTPQEFRDHLDLPVRTAMTDVAAPVSVDSFAAHPTYADLSWLAVIDPGERTSVRLRDLLGSAHERARRRAERRSAADRSAD